MDLKNFRQTCFTVGTSHMYIPHFLGHIASYSQTPVSEAESRTPGQSMSALDA